MQRKVGKHLPIEAELPPQIGRNPRLDRLAQLFDWERLGAVVQAISAAPTGRPSYPSLMLVKVLLLQQWYAASDPELAAHRLVVKAGTLLDATLVQAQSRRPTGTAQPGAKSPTDPDAAWTGRGAKAHFGYKVQLGVDAGSGSLRAARLTAAQIAERMVADTLIQGDEAAVYADRAYDSQERRRRLKHRGTKDRIMHRAHQHQAHLPYWQQRRNALIARVRAPVEQVFGTLKRLYHYRRVRYLGLARNATELWCKCLAYNLRRAERLLPRPAPGVVVP